MDANIYLNYIQIILIMLNNFMIKFLQKKWKNK